MAPNIPQDAAARIAAFWSGEGLVERTGRGAAATQVDSALSGPKSEWYVLDVELRSYLLFGSEAAGGHLGVEPTLGASVAF